MKRKFSPHLPTKPNSACGCSSKFVQEESEEDFDEDEVAENTAEWGAFGFIFVLALLSFADSSLGVVACTGKAWTST